MKNILDIRKEKNLYYILPANVRTDPARLSEISAIVVACLYYEDLLEESLSYLSNVPEYMDICICTSDPSLAKKAEVFCSRLEHAFVVVKENRGRDISSLLVACREILSNYTYICFVHDKKSVHALPRQRWEIDLWIRNLWSSMLDSASYIENVLCLFLNHPDLGLLVPPEPVGDIMRNWYYNTWGPNFDNTVLLAERLGLSCNISRAKPPFTIGTVFWCRYEALEKLFRYGFQYEDFPEEPMASDGTLSHAIERILGYVAQDAGYDTGTVLTCDYAQYLISFVQDRLQDAFDVLDQSYQLYDFEQLKLAKKARRNYSDEMICAVKRFAGCHPRLYVYGAGVWAERIVEMIDAQGIDLQGILVTDPEKNPVRVGSYKCAKLESAIGRYAGIIIAVRDPKAVDEIRRLIDEKGLFDSVSIHELEQGEPKKQHFKRSVSDSVKFSVLMPVYNAETVYLSRAIKSVYSQSYANWELCIADDGSVDQRVKDYLYQIHDDRVKVRMMQKNGGISAATNAAAKMADGDYLLFMDQDDLLHPDALLKFYQEIRKSDADMLYSDMDKVDEYGVHSGVFYKPQWSPDLMTAQMYVGHLLGVKKELFAQAGGFRSACDGSQDYDLVLRVSMLARSIRHVEGALYSWRLLKTSTALCASAKPYTQTAALKAIQDYLDKKYGINAASVRETEWLHIYDIIYDLPRDAAVSVIVPIVSREELSSVQLRRLCGSCRQKKDELLLVGNLQDADILKGARWVPSAKTSWAGLCNDGVKASKGTVIVLLDPYIQMLTPDWAKRLAAGQPIHWARMAFTIPQTITKDRRSYESTKESIVLPAYPDAALDIVCGRGVCGGCFSV